jgi:hypothetical protein
MEPPSGYTIFKVKKWVNFLPKKEAPMSKDIRIVEKINTQLERFVEVLSKGLTKPKRKFIHQMLFGIQASGDIKLSEIARSLNEEIKLLKTEMRLSRNLQEENLYLHINKKLIEHSKDKIDPDTVLALDLTDISKPYAKKMDFLSLVWDGVTKKPTKGYWVLEVIGANIYQDYIYPLYSELYSSCADEFRSENRQILKAIDTLDSYLNGKGVWVIDRGGDRKTLINQLLSRDLRFIIRIKPNRYLSLATSQTKLAGEIASNLSCFLKYQLEIDNQGYKEKRKLFLGKIKVRIPGIGYDLFLVVIKGFSQEPMLLLTNVDKNPVIILEMYLTRWKVEESIRFLKQKYNLEDVRVRNYSSLKNTVAILLAVFYFLSVYLGRKLKLNILLKKIYEKAKRFFQIPV